MKSIYPKIVLPSLFQRSNKENDSLPEIKNK